MRRTVSQFLCMHMVPGKLVVAITTLTLMLKSYELVSKKKLTDATLLLMRSKISKGRKRSPQPLIIDKLGIPFFIY